MDIQIREVENRKDLKRFIFLPEKIHIGHKNWVPPIWMDEKKFFNPAKNDAFTYCYTTRLLAYRGDKPVGRILGIINRRYNDHTGEKQARWSFLETWEDREVVHALLSHVEAWAREKGMTRIIGPFGFTDQDPEGLLIKGYEYRCTIASHYNYEWMNAFVEAEGYTKDLDYVVYKLDVPEEIPEFYKKILTRVKRRGEFQLHEFTKTKELKPWVKPILTLMNETYGGTDIYGYTPLDEKEMEALAKRYLPVLDPRFVKAVTVEGEPVSFVIGIPDMTEGIQKARGRLLPFGFLKIMQASKKTEQLDLLLGAIKEEYRGRGLDVMMGTAMIISANTAGKKIMDTHHEMETNTSVRHEMERMGGEIYKIYRIYQKEL